MKEAFQHLMEILAKLEEKNIYYKLDMVSTEHDRTIKAPADFPDNYLLG